jgi:hypothetical protein
MADIVLGIGTSHGPMLSTPPDQWGQRVEADRQRERHDYRGKRFTFEELVELRRGEGLDGQIGPEHWRERHARCGRALARLADTFEDASPDVAVIVGNDQHELFLEDNMPVFAVYYGETIENVPFTEEQKTKLAPGIGVAEPGHHPAKAATYPGLPSLGRHLIESLVKDEFDVAQSNRLPTGSDWITGIPHAYGFVYRQIMRDRVVPNVPVVLNTFYPPNQPSIRRCYRFGQALARAIAAWDDPRRVALICSGGLSHFVIDEELDRDCLGAMKNKDGDALLALPEDRFRSGTSEIKNWVPVASALESTPLEMELVDYVPCYRSEAGTGNAMAFALWR